MKNTKTIFNEIGSNFHFEDIGCKKNNNKFPENIIFLNSGRSAIRLILKHINKKTKVALLPVFTCSTVIDPFIESGYKIFYYDINEDFSINDENLNELVLKYKPSVVLVHSYFSKDTLKSSRSYLKQLKNKGIIIIEDITQILFRKNLNLDESNYILGSIRKWCSVPEGGFALSNSNDFINTSKFLPNNLYLEKQLAAQKRKTEYINNPDNYEIKDSYMQLFKESKEILDNDENIYILSDYTKRMLNNLDVDNIRNKRKENYTYLNDELKKIDWIKSPLANLDNDDVPLFYPILIENNRKEFQTYMSKQNIFLPIIWPMPEHCKPFVDEYKNKLYEKIICIPIDQRYSLKDMERIITNIKKYGEGI